MKISYFDNLLVYDGAMSVPQIERLISQNRLNGLEIKTLLRDEKLADLSFLEGADFLKGLRVVSNFPYDYSILRSLINLEWLSINATGFDNGDFLTFKKLGDLMLSFRRRNLKLKLPASIRHLYIEEVRHSSLNFIIGVETIQTLRIKSSNLKTLGGIERFCALKSLCLEGISGLGTIDEQLPDSIEHLKLNSLYSLKSMKLNIKPKELLVQNCKLLVD